MNTILTITGSDSTGMSGVQADINTMASLGVHAVSAITSITAQNTLGIQHFFNIPHIVVRQQIEAVINDMQPQTVKIGMIREAETLMEIVDVLLKYKPKNVIYYPILYSTSGEELINHNLLLLITQHLLPLCNVIVVKKGESAEPFLQETNRKNIVINDFNEHGLSNVFASSLTVYIDKGLSIDDAVKNANSYMEHLTAIYSGIKGRGAELYNKFITLLNNHIHEKTDVAFYAEKLNVSTGYLAQLAKKHGGKSPKIIIDEKLIEYIKVELLTTNKTIQQIAYSFNFNSQAHFTKIFKKISGLTPTKYREINNIMKLNTNKL